MRHLNYTHLLYFWTVAREGSIVAASRALNLTPQTISGQLKSLEQEIGEPLFNRVGRGLVLTDTGQVVKQYADEIFSLGAELGQRVRSQEPLVPTTLHVGIVNTIPKLIALRILEPALAMDHGWRIICREAALDDLLGDLAVHRLDLVVSDRPLPTGSHVRAFNHPLGGSGIGLFAHKSIARRYGGPHFPDALDHAPMLLPAITSTLRRSLDDWFDARGITPTVIAECDDSALLKAFGEAGKGVFAAPLAIAEEVQAMYHSRLLGELEGVRETWVAISPERRVKHPAVMAIAEHARELLVRS